MDNVNDMSKSNDYFLVANDFATYMKAQEEADRIYRDQVRLHPRDLSCALQGS